MLERGGFDVVKAKDASVALSTLETLTQGDKLPSLIILDVMMPGMSGIELCAEIRKQPQTAEVPILILSARHDADSIMRGMEAGANDYLPKPILHHDLVTKVRDMIQESIR